MDKFAIREWYYWPCRAYSGAFNMAADHTLAQHRTRLLDRPLLRFFTWEPYCVSLGYHQNPEEVDQQKCRERGIDVVRRPTGGRAILHADELTYSVIYPAGEMEKSQFYRLVHLPFVHALQKMGIPAKFQASQPDFHQFYKTDKAAVCFAASAKYEVEIEGKKLIGSAQRVYPEAFLQHGSLLLGPDHEQLVDLLKLSPEKKEIMRRHIRQHTVHLRRFSEKVSAAELAENIRSSFAEIFGIRFIPLEEDRSLKKELDRIKDFHSFTSKSADTRAEL